MRRALLILATVDTVELPIDRDEWRNLMPIKKYKLMIKPIGRTKKMIVDIINT